MLAEEDKEEGNDEEENPSATATADLLDLGTEETTPQPATKKKIHDIKDDLFYKSEEKIKNFLKKQKIEYIRNIKNKT